MNHCDQAIIKVCIKGHRVNTGKGVTHFTAVWDGAKNVTRKIVQMDLKRGVRVDLEDKGLSGKSYSERVHCYKR